MPTRRIKRIDLAILANILLIFLALLFFDSSNIDIFLQKFFFNFETKKWLIDKDEPVKKFFFYDLPKILLGVAIVVSLLVLVFSKIHNKTYYRQLLIFFLGIALIPLIAGNIKKFTNIYCPNQLEIYNGEYPYIKILEHYPSNSHQPKKGQCFPAGHAVTGFCLMILFFVFQKKSWKIGGLLFGFISGWILGFYQIAKGAHFLSDTVISMLCCFLLAMIIARVIGCIFDEQMNN